MLIAIQTVFFGFLSRNLIKEMFFLHLITQNGRRILEFFLLFYFLFVFLLQKSLVFSLFLFLIPLIFTLILFIFLKKQEEKNFLSQLCSLLLPLESQMKSGISFINGWQKAQAELKSEKIRTKVQNITEILKFQQKFHYPDKDVENFVQDLRLIHQSAHPLQKLKHLKRKVKIEQSFQIKSKRALLQIRIQSGILSLFYFGLLAWTVTAHSGKYIHLIAFSFILFFSGLLWIFQTGRKMKWSV